MSKVYIIILNFNGWRDTQECLESVLKLDYPDFQVVVVDNNSTDGSMNHLLDWAKGYEVATVDNEALSQLSTPHSKKPINYAFYNSEELTSELCIVESDSPVVFIQSNVNRGFSHGNNVGIKYACIKNDYDFVWLLNNDTVCEKRSLRLLVEGAMRNGYGVAGTSLFYYNAPHEVQCYGGRTNKFFGTTSHIKKFPSVRDNVNYVVGASFLIKKEVVSVVGMLPEEYFLYYEETDYCFKAKLNGFKIGVIEEAVVYHKEGGTIGSGARENKKTEFMDMLVLRNRVIFHKKYLGGGVGLWLGLFISALIRVRRGQFKRAFEVLRLIK